MNAAFAGSTCGFCSVCCVGYGGCRCCAGCTDLRLCLLAGSLLARAAGQQPCKGVLADIELLIALRCLGHLYVFGLHHDRLSRCGLDVLLDLQGWGYIHNHRRILLHLLA